MRTIWSFPARRWRKRWRRSGMARPYVTDTQMAKAGINKKRLAQYGGEVLCFMSDEDVARTAKENGTTRAAACMDKAADLYGDRKLIFAVGNAPTALVRLYELIRERKIVRSSSSPCRGIRQRGPVEGIDPDASGYPAYRGQGKKRRQQYRGMHL